MISSKRPTVTDSIKARAPERAHHSLKGGMEGRRGFALTYGDRAALKVLAVQESLFFPSFFPNRTTVRNSNLSCHRTLFAWGAATSNKGGWCRILAFFSPPPTVRDCDSCRRDRYSSIGEEDCGSKSSPWRRYTVLEYQYLLDDPSHFFIRRSEFFLSSFLSGLNSRVQGPNLYGL